MKYLSRNGLVDVISISSRNYSHTEVQSAISFLSSYGIGVNVLEHNNYYHPYYCTIPDVALEQFVRALNNYNADCIWCISGGFGTERLLPLLDETEINVSKPIIGFSDISILLYYLYMVRGWSKLVHGPVIRTLCSTSNRDELIRFLVGEIPDITFSVSQMNDVSAKVIYGKALPMNLTNLVRLIGTSFQRPHEGHILFLEDWDEKPHQYLRMLNHVKDAGMFEGVKGVVFGSFSREEREQYIESFVLYDFAVSVLDELSIPAYKTSAFGHGKMNTPIPFGSNATISGTENKLQVKLVP